MVVNEIHGNVLMRMLSVTYNTHTQAELYIDYGKYRAFTYIFYACETH